jgi:quercetin dioxygenase-like cupin family protein
MRSLLLLFLVGNGASVAAQAVIDPDTLWCAVHQGAAKVTPLHSDSLASSFLICIHTGVKPHLHRAHTEHVLVLEGSGDMMLDGTRRSVKAGDVIVIPAGTVHSAVASGDAPLRVLSIQSPFFDGSDRLMIEDAR